MTRFFRLSAVGLAALALLASEAHAQAFESAATPATLTDVGFMSAPAVADLDGDGDLDVVAGRSDGTFAFFLNTAASPTDPPVLELQSGASDPFDGLSVGYAAQPAATNLDADPEAEVLVGQGDGTYLFLDLVGGVFAPGMLTGPPTDVGFNSAPTWGDFDGDGDQDLIVGRMLGTFAYFENTAGAGNSPDFTEQVGANNPLDGVDVGFSSVPAAADYDGDGDVDLVTGNVDGELAVMKNTAGAGNPAVFAAGVAFGDAGFSASPGAGNLAGDGRPDLLSGESAGDWDFYENLRLNLIVTSFTDPLMPGGTLEIEGTAINGTSSTIRTRMRVSLDAPNGKTYTRNGLRIRVPGGDTVGPTPLVNPIDAPNATPIGSYTATVEAIDTSTGDVLDSEVFTFDVTPPDPLTAATSEGEALLTLEPEDRAPVAGPNPFRDHTTLRFGLAEADEVDLRVYDARGREVAVLASGTLAPGFHEAALSSADFPAGVYIWRYVRDGEATIGRILLVR